MRAFLILEDGTVFEGVHIGARKEIISEIVFNTSMAGYPEVLTDPSYAGQAVCMTYPLIGNYGICREDMESKKPWTDGLIVRELSRMGSNFRMDLTLEQFLEEGDNYVVTLTGQLSGSYNAAMQARAIYREEGGKGNVHVFNSRSASSGQAQIALLVRELTARCIPFAQVVEQVEAYIAQMKTLFVLENLDNLRKNGALVTGALRVKLLCGATPEGEIEKLGQGLSVRQTLARMVSRMADDVGHAGRRLIIAHCNCRERAEYVRDLIQKRCRFGEILIVPTGGISTVYADDGGIIAAY